MADHSSPDTRPSLLRGVLSLLAELIVGLYVIVDGIVRPLFGPIMRFLSALRLIKRLEAWIGSLNPYVILVLLGVPFGIAELTKVYAVILMAEEHFRLGMTLFIGAYVVSILVCERTFHAGKGQLLKIWWFKVGYDWVIAIKDAILDWFRETRVWQAAAALRQRIGIGLRRTRVRLRHVLGMKDAARAKGVVGKGVVGKGVLEQR